MDNRRAGIAQSATTGGASARTAGCLTPLTHSPSSATLLEAKPHAGPMSSAGIQERGCAPYNWRATITPGIAIQQNTSTSTLPCLIGMSAYNEMPSASRSPSARLVAPRPFGEVFGKAATIIKDFLHATRL